MTTEIIGVNYKLDLTTEKSGLNDSRLDVKSRRMQKVFAKI